MGIFDSFFHPEKGYKKAQDTFNQYYTQGSTFPQYYFGMGTAAQPNLTEILSKLMNPQALSDEWAKGYKTSDYAKNLMESAKEQGLNTASAQGLLGSPLVSKTVEREAGRVASQDERNYMNDLMQKYLASLAGWQNIYGTGATAANALATNATNAANTNAALSFGEANAPGNLLSKLLEGAASFATPIGQAWGMSKLGLSPNINKGWSFTGS